MSVYVGLLAVAARAATYTWDGGSTVDSNWGTAENWNPDGAPVSASDTYLKFDGGARLAPQQNIATPFTLNRLDFLGGGVLLDGLYHRRPPAPIRRQRSDSTAHLPES